MHHNIKKEKCDISILSANLGSRNNNFINKNANVQRPGSLEIKVKPDNKVNIISRGDTYPESVNSWNSDNLDNFILQIKNANNTPSPITPNSFFNPLGVTQDQEQFANDLTLHLNKIQEDYKSGMETPDSSYLISSINQEKPMSIATVSLGNKVFLLNQISHNFDSNDNQCINYGVMDLPTTVSLQHENLSTMLHQPLKISQIQSLRTSNTSSPAAAILCSSQNVQFAPYTPQPISAAEQYSGFLKTADGVIYTRVPDSSQHELLSQLNSLSNTAQIAPAVVTLDRDLRSLSASSNDSSYGTNDSSQARARPNNGSSNGSQLPSGGGELEDVQRRLERKRARNRDAARKCRDRKNGLISSLEQKYAKQTAEKDLIRDKLLKSLEEIRRLTDYIAAYDPHSKFANFTGFLSDIKINELTEADLKDLNLI